ncbi:putative uncharacterized protein DDB_G0268364 [Haliotis cracherodii]|uniref:putative uncharacterized protein DDB_G0268364 n=1 Tax=Haliotis cracherodii TaxID=6455 RepID=UPI0039E7DB8A
MSSAAMVAVSLIMTTLTLSVLPPLCDAHGRLMDPPARNSMWRLGFNNPVNYNDNELYCGGRMVQWLRNSGKCGVCGDAYHGKNDHEAGGKYANGIITRSFHEGDTIPVTVHLTANHLGWFEFRICPVNDPKKRVTQKCLDKHQLKRPDGKGMKYFVPKGKYNAFFNYTVQLPPGLTCKQCVIQWKYRTGNTWDKDDKSGLFCLGCGPQEEFYNCADIEILPKGKKSKWTKEQNMKPSTTQAPEEKKIKINVQVESKHDMDKKNLINKIAHKTAEAATAKKPAVKKQSNSIATNPTSRRKMKPKHPQDVKYNWRASTPWLMQRRNMAGRRRLGMRRKQLSQKMKSHNNLSKGRQQQPHPPKVQNEPNVKQAKAKPTTKTVEVKHPVSRKPVRQTAPATPKTTPPRPKSTPKPKPKTQPRRTVTQAPRAKVLRGPSKSWLISSNKRQQSPFRKPTRPVKQTIRPIKHTIRPVKQTPRPIRQTPRPVKQTIRPLVKQTVLEIPRSPVQNGRLIPKGVTSTKTTTHNCVTEKPQTNAVKKTMRTPPPRQDDTQPVHNNPRKSDKQEYSQRSSNLGHQRVISFQPVPQQPLVNHRQTLPSHQSQGTYGNNQMSTMWWNQYQRPVNYFWDRPAVTPLLKCRATITLGGGMDEWCTANCNANFCPGGMCMCQPDEPSYPAFSMFPGQTQSWTNTYRPRLNEYTQARASQSLSPFAPRHQTVPHSIRTQSQPQQHNQQHGQQHNQQHSQQRTQQHSQQRTQQRPQQRPQQRTRQQLHRQQPRRQPQMRSQSPKQPSRSIFSPPRERTPSHSTPARPSQNVWAQKGKYFCRATGRYAGLKRFDDWCSTNCMNVICPLLICECNSL